MTGDTKNKNSQTFELGLVMAGAVSAGAYTAGVLDFLMEALEEWYQAKANGAPDIPPHEVKLKVVTGTSAGAIAAAIFASELRRGLQPVHYDSTASNALFDAWVNQVDIDQLLNAKDLANDKARVNSFLDSMALDEIARTALNVSWTRTTLPPYISDPLHLYFCVTNLRGVPYSIRFQADESGGEYGMSQHADYLHFYLSPKKPSPDCRDAYYLGAENNMDGHWALLKETALASGSFPVGLAARTLNRPLGQYNRRKWAIPQYPTGKDNEDYVCEKEEEIEPAWPKTLLGHVQLDEWDYESVNVDGGVANNEPFELARRCLAGSEGRNPRSGEEARRALLMVDPFPNEASLDLEYSPERRKPLFAALPDLLSAMISELRFKKDDLVLARDPEVYSRFLIAPTRTVDGKRQQYALASGGLGGFLGFFHQAYRRHDYQLGRRNCQRFLRTTLGLKFNNDLFKGWDPRLRNDYQFRRPEDGAELLPIIPLVGKMQKEEPAPAWPSGQRPDTDALRKKLARRLDTVIDRLIETEISAWTTRFLSKRGWQLYRINGALLRLVRTRLFGTEGRGPIDYILTMIADALNQRGL